MENYSDWKGPEYWKNYMERYFGAHLIDWWKDHVEITEIESSGTIIQIEVFDTHIVNSPTLVFSHGIAGYARVLLPFIHPLYEAGWNIVAPDLKGYGYNKEKKGIFTWNEHVENLKDAAIYARNRFFGDIYIGGASMGGPLSFVAGSQLEFISGGIFWCLWDLSDDEFVKGYTRSGKFSGFLTPFLKLGSFVLGNFRINTTMVIGYHTLSSKGSKMDLLIRSDPQAGTKISLKGALSLIKESGLDKSIDLWANSDKMVLIMHPGGDRMVPATFSQKIYDKLKEKGCKNVVFEILEKFEHFPTDEDAYSRFTQIILEYFNN